MPGEDRRDFVVVKDEAGQNVLRVTLSLVVDSSLSKARIGTGRRGLCRRRWEIIPAESQRSHIRRSRSRVVRGDWHRSQIDRRDELVRSDDTPSIF